jgi:hypothetical protein
MIRPEGAAQENVINRKSNHIRNDSSTALSGRVFDMDANLGLKPQAESFHPFGIIPCETDAP